MASNTAQDQEYQAYLDEQEYQKYQSESAPAPNPESTVQPKAPSIREHLESNIKSYNDTLKPDAPKPEQNFLGQLETALGMSYQGLKKGLENSTTGLIARGKMPEDSTPEERTNRAFNIASHIGAIAGDLPLMAASGMVGAAVSAAEGATVGSIVPGVGTAVGGVGFGAVGGAMAAFAVPAGIRKHLIDQYQNGDAKTPGEFASRLMAQAWETIKGATTGAATALTGGAAGGVSGPMAQMSAEVATMTTVSNALEGHLPTIEDFEVNAVTIGGLHAVGVLKPKLMNIFAKTGETPDQVALSVEKDPVLKQQLLAGGESEPAQASPFEEKPAEIGAPKVEVPKEEGPVLSDAQKRVRSQIVDRPELPSSTWVEKIKNGYESVLTAVKDDLTPLKIMTEAAQEKASVDLEPSKNPEILARNFRDWGGKLLRMFQKDTFDFHTGESNGEGYINILKDIPEKDHVGLNEYMVAARSLELGERGLGQGISREDAKQIVESGEEKFEPVFRRIVDFQNRVKQYAVDSGILSSKKSDLFDQLNQDYVPLNKLLDVDPLSGKREGKTKIYQPIGTSERQILNPLQSIFENTMAVVKAAEENRVKRAIVDIPELVENGFAEKVAEAGPLGKDEISVKIDGEPEKWRFKPEVAAAIKAMDYSPQFTSAWAKLFSAPVKLATKVLRVGVIGDWGFGVRHGLRAVGAAEIQTKYPNVPLSGIVDAMGEVFNHSDDYWNFISSGASNGSLDRVMKLLDAKPWENPNPSMQQKVGSKIWGPGDDPLYTKAWNALFSPVKISEAIVQASDMLPKFREFKRGGGLTGDENTRAQAAFDARNVSVDYTRQGALIKLISFSRPFLNVDMQGTFRALEGLKSPRTIAMGTALITLPEIVNFLFNHDDPRYKNAPSWMHAISNIIPLHHWVSATQEEAANFSDLKGMSRQKDDGSWEVDKGPTVRIPRFFTLGLMFGAIPHMILDHYMDENPKAFDALKERLMSSFLPFGPATIVAPIEEQASNRNKFTGGPLVPAYLERDLPQFQYTPYTHEFAKQLGKIFGYLPQIGPDDAQLSSPVVVENYMRAWGGTLGQYVLDISDKALHAAGVGRGFEGAQKDWDELPIVKEFFTHFPSSKAQAIIDFDKNYKENQRYINTVADLSKRGDPDAAMALVEAHPEFQQNLESAHQSMQNILRSLNQINQLPGMTPTEKKQLMTTATFQAMAIAEQGNQMVNDFRKAMKQNKAKGE